MREAMKVAARMVPFPWGVTAYQADTGPMNWEGAYEVAAGEDGGTRITGWGKLGLRGWRRVLEPFMGGGVRSGEAAELRWLKDLLEPVS